MSEDRYELPNGWVWVVLKDIVSSLELGSRPWGGVKHIKEGVPSIGGEHLTYEGKFNFDKIRYIPIDFFKEMSKGHIERRDILIVKDGATTGKTSFVDANFSFKEAAINEHIFKLRAFEGHIFSKYLFFFLYSHIGNRQLLACFQGSAQGGINKSFVNKVYIPISPHNEQKRIVQKIENLYGHLNKTKQELAKILPLIKKFRQLVLARAFNGELTKEWREKQKDLEPASKLLERIREERLSTLPTAQAGKKKLGKKYKEPEPIDKFDLPELPEGWEWARLVNVCFFEYGEGLPKNKRIKGKIPVYGSNGIVGYYNKYCIKGPAIIVGRKGSFGKVNISEIDCWPIDTTYYITKDSVLVDFGFLYFLLINLRLNEYDRSTAIPGLNREEAHSKVIAFPPVQEQREIVKKINELYRQADTIEKSVKTAQSYCEKLSQSILAKAFRGELVEQDPSDEPAEELLKKIQEQKKKLEYKKRKS